MIHFVIDADIYWPKLIVNILTCFRKKRKGVILIVEGRESEGLGGRCRLHLQEDEKT